MNLKIWRMSASSWWQNASWNSSWKVYRLEQITRFSIVRSLASKDPNGTHPIKPSTQPRFREVSSGRTHSTDRCLSNSKSRGQRTDGGGGWGIVREFGIDMYTLLHLEGITNEDLLYSTGNSAQCYVAAWMLGELGGEWIHVYVCLSPIAVRLKPSEYC